MILSLLQGYQYHFKKESAKDISVSPPKRQGDRRRSFNFKKDYNLEEFILSHTKSNRRFMRKFTETSHFITFLHNYREGSENPNKLIIDSAMKKQNHQKIDAPIF
jgi:hypothetical protein